MTTLEKLQCFFFDLMYKKYISEKYLIDCTVDDSIINRLERYIFLLEFGCDLSNAIECDINNIISFNEDFISCMNESSFCPDEGVTTELCSLTITDTSTPTPSPCSVIYITESPAL